jgi:serine/threonine-protein kinase
MYETGSVIQLTGGQYRLREQLGVSSYGVVWRAEADATASQVALKLVNAEQMRRAPPSLRSRWQDSARAEIAFLRGLAPWDGRHIVRLLDSGDHAGMPAMALELLDGDLGAWLGAGNQIPPAQAFAWIGQVNQALAKVHANGWRYLDLKPANLLIERGMLALKLADFGTNRRLDDLRAHSYAGTANWQAPEQFFPHAGGYLTGAHSDYFALGALLYYFVCGRVLRYSATCAQAYRVHGPQAGAALARTGRPPVLTPDEAALFADSVGGAARPALVLLRGLLAERPADRPRHALDISRQLAALRSAA